MRKRALERCDRYSVHKNGALSDRCFEGARDWLIIEGRKDIFIHEVTAGRLISEQDDSLFRNILKLLFWPSFLKLFFLLGCLILIF